MTSTRVFAKSVFSALLLALAAVMAAAQWTPEEMMNVKSVGTVQVSPDGKRVAYCVTEPVMTEDKSEYLTQIWMAAADGSGSVPVHPRREVVRKIPGGLPTAGGSPSSRSGPARTTSGSSGPTAAKPRC